MTAPARIAAAWRRSAGSAPGRPTGAWAHRVRVHWPLICSLCLLPVLTGCSLPERLRQASLAFDQADAKVVQGHARFVAGRSAAGRNTVSQDIDKPWIAGPAQPLARELTLPAVLRGRVQTTLLFAEGSDDLRQVARRITAVTGIPVHVRPDALLPAAQFLPRMIGDQAGGALGLLEDPGPIGLSDGPAALPLILDRLAAHLGVHWRYGQGRIEFYRTETRVFNVRALTLDARAQASLGLGRGHAEGGFVSASNTQLSSGELDTMKTLRMRLEAFLSRAGVLVVEPGAAANIVVTDTPDVLERIAQYLDQENRALTRRVRLVFEELTIALNEQAQASLDWNLVFSGAHLAAHLAVPGLATTPAGQLGMQAVRGKLTGSEAVIQALGETVTLVRRSSVPMLTLNRRPVTHAVRTTFSYIDRIETTPVTGASGLAVPAISVNQKEETVGSLLTLVPDAQENGQILLSLAYDNTVAQPLKTVTFGDKDNPLQLQQLTIEGNGTVQQLALQPGQPLVVSGFDRRQSEAAERRLGPGLPALFGGGDQLQAQRLATVLIITAEVEEGL